MRKCRVGAWKTMARAGLLPVGDGSPMPNTYAAPALVPCEQCGKRSIGGLCIACQVKAHNEAVVAKGTH